MNKDYVVLNKFNPSNKDIIDLLKTYLTIRDSLSEDERQIILNMFRLFEPQLKDSK